MKCFVKERQHRNDVDLFSLINLLRRMEFNDVVDIALRVLALNHSCILNNVSTTSARFSSSYILFMLEATYHPHGLSLPHAQNFEKIKKMTGELNLWLSKWRQKYLERKNYKELL